MSTATITPLANKEHSTATMKALVFRGVNQIALEQVAIPRPGPGEAVIRVTLTTICGTDLHIVRGEYPVRLGLVIGHEPVGVIHELGGRRGLQNWRPRTGRRDHAVRTVQLLPRGRPFAVRRPRRRLEIRQHH